MNSYREILEQHTPRLLNLGCFDVRGPYYGSFDRAFWHLRQRDFSSSIYQMAALPLLRSNMGEEVETFLYQSLSFLCQIQHRDGSFDEWYPFERGWGGPTAYILDFLARTFLEYSDRMPASVRSDCLAAIKLAAEFTKKGWERDVLFNHVALAVLALEAVAKIDAKIVSPNDLDRARDWLANHFNQREGWGREYLGADPGYQTASLSFLAKAHDMSGHSFYEEMALESLEFIKYFHYPDQSYALGIGSRETNCVFDFGVNYWRQKSPIAHNLSYAVGQGKCGLGPSELDDHYFVYRMLELSDCLRFEIPNEGSSLFSKSFIGRKHLEDAQIIIDATKSHYRVINLQKGGAFLEFDKQAEELIQADYGVQANSDSKLYSTFLPSAAPRIKIAGDEIEVMAPFYQVKTMAFSPLKLILFRIVLGLTSFHAAGAYLLKSLIRSLITTKFKSANFKNKRNIYLRKDSALESSDHLDGNLSGREFIYGGLFENRYVPQSKFQSKHKIRFRPRLGEAKK